MSPIDSYDGATWVFTGGPGSFGTVAFIVLAVLGLLAFFVRVILHENHAYTAMIHHEPPEPGPAVEGEPTVY